MRQFSGFPARTRFTPVPDVFFSSLLPQISDIAELKTTLHVFWLLYHKRGFPRFITFQELLNDGSLMSSLREAEKSGDEALRGALEMAVKRGTILHLVLKMQQAAEDVYFLNTQSDQRVVAKIQNGELSLAGLKAGVPVRPTIETGLPDIFTLYEENIGMLTPMIAEELKAAEKLYPEAWIRDAIKESVNQGKRKWSYISAILERWSAEGRGDGTYRRDFKKTGPDKYNQQKYGDVIQR